LVHNLSYASLTRPTISGGRSMPFVNLPDGQMVNPENVTSVRKNKDEMGVWTIIIDVKGSNHNIVIDCSNEEQMSEYLKKISDALSLW
jgi:hypothetical protein